MDPNASQIKFEAKYKYIIQNNIWGNHMWGAKKKKEKGVRFIKERDKPLKTKVFPLRNSSS